MNVGAIGPPHGWSDRYVQEVVLPEVLMPGLGAGIQRGGNPDGWTGQIVLAGPGLGTGN